MHTCRFGGGDVNAEAVDCSNVLGAPEGVCGPDNPSYTSLGGRGGSVTVSFEGEIEIQQGFELTVYECGQAQSDVAFDERYSVDVGRGTHAAASGWVTRCTWNPRDADAQRIHLLASIPGIGPDRAESLLSHFGTLETVFTATEPDLLTAPGIGPKLAHKLRTLATARAPTRARRAS